VSLEISPQQQRTTLTWLDYIDSCDCMAAPLRSCGKVDKKAVLLARKPRDAAAVLFGLKFAHNIHYTKAWLRSSKHTGAKQNAKWPFKGIQDHVFWSRWKGDKGLSNTKY